MCNLYRLTSNVEAMRRLFRLDSTSAPNLPVFEEIYPDRDAPVIITGAAGERRITMMRWGFPPPVAGTLKVKFADFSMITRAQSLAVPIASRAMIAEVGRAILVRVLPVPIGVRLLGLTLSGLDCNPVAATQSSLLL